MNTEVEDVEGVLMARNTQCWERCSDRYLMSIWLIIFKVASSLSNAVRSDIFNCANMRIRVSHENTE